MKLTYHLRKIERYLKIFKKLIQIYEKSDSLEKTVILPIVDHNKYTKEINMKYFIVPSIRSTKQGY